MQSATMAQTFGRGRRLLTKREFDAVLRQPLLRIRRGGLWLAARPNSVGVSRLGMIVAKRVVRRAVGRNRVKRMIRESFRQRASLPAADLVVRVVAPRPRLTVAEVDRFFAVFEEVFAKRVERSGG